VRSFLQQNPTISREIEDQVRVKLLPVKLQRNGEQAADTA
jgi:hypothetical protein